MAVVQYFPYGTVFALMAFVRYVSIRPESLAARGEVMKCPYGVVHNISLMEL